MFVCVGEERGSSRERERKRESGLVLEQKTGIEREENQSVG